MDNLSILKFVQDLASMTRDGEPDPSDEAEDFVMENDDAFEALDSAIGTARRLLGQPEHRERSETDELERVRDWLRNETGIWRVQFNKGFGQVPRIHYPETVGGDTEQDVRRWQCQNAPHGVWIVSCRRATEADAEEVLALERGEIRR